MRHRVPTLAAVVSSLVLCVVLAKAQPQIFPDGVPWIVTPAFGQAGEGRSNVSGATCIGAVTARPVIDSARFAQLFSISGQTIPFRAAGRHQRHGTAQQAHRHAKHGGRGA
jgi:hypothetical protein